MRRIAGTFGLAIGLAVYVADDAGASRPVPRTVTGCVASGELAAGPYTYRVRRSTPGGLIPVSLAPYEGKRIRVKGQLLPGDLLVAASIEIVAPTCGDHK